MENKEEDTEYVEENERFIVFTLFEKRFGIPLLKIKEVIEVTKTIPLPQAPHYYKGLINLRGQIISVIDLNLKLNNIKTEMGPRSAIIILDLASHCLGFLVDSINFVLSTRPEEIQPCPDLENRTMSKNIMGVVRNNNSLILLLDIEQTLNSNDLKITSKSNLRSAA